jgi:phosphatidylserine/phosphatidylglycerophosphate/cardiolipin synthase-like enzyme
MKIFFSDKDFKSKLINIFRNVEKEIYIMMYRIDDSDIINEINNLATKNININIIVDFLMNKNLKKLLNKKCNITFIKDNLFHHKHMLIDNNIIIYGSSNLHVNSVNGYDTEYILKFENQKNLIDYHKNIFKSYIENIKITNKEFYEENNIVQRVWYSKYTNLMEKFLFYIESAKKSIIIMHFWLTSKIIIDKLIEKSKIINIKILLDKRSFERDKKAFNNLNAVEYLYLNNIDVKIIDTKLFHYKVILIDNNITLTGSQNLYDIAFKNHYEDISLIKSEKLCALFKSHYEWLLNNYKCYSYKEWELNLFCIANNISKNNICIVGSHLLSKLNLRKSNDIDFIITTNERNRLKLPKINKSCGKYIEIVSCNWHPEIKDDDFIKNSTYNYTLPNGFKICKKQMLIDKKKKHNREKDILDLKLIETLN